MNEIRICDTHNDFLTELALWQFPDYIENCKGYGVEMICASYWSTRRKLEDIEKELSQRAEILHSTSNFLLHIEDMWWVVDENRLENLLQLNPFSCSLTWNEKNCLASGSAERGGLTTWGRECVKRLIDAKVVVDVAHLNRQGFYEVAKIVGKNIYCSHAGFYGIKHHRRNLTDKQIDIIVKSNGFVGLFFFDKCIKKVNKRGKAPFCVADIVENINYFTSRWGCDNLGIGSDFFGIETYPFDLQNYGDFKNLAKELKKNGYSEKQVDKIFYQNFKDYMDRLNSEKT